MNRIIAKIILTQKISPLVTKIGATPATIAVPICIARLVKAEGSENFLFRNSAPKMKDADVSISNVNFIFEIQVRHNDEILPLLLLENSLYYCLHA